MIMKVRKVAVGISGGVDSAVAALLLKWKGYNVEGIFMQNWDIADEKGYCSVDADYSDACEVCEILKINLQRVNFVKQYWNDVFCYLIKEYQSGCTPNPDILCNRYIKFDQFYTFATQTINADAIATGHYARTSFGPYLQNFNPSKGVRLLKAKDSKKDQTFFLCQIKQQALQRTMFPLGDLTKQEVKMVAKENGLGKFAQKKESMGICFIGSRNFQDFIKEYVEDKPGDFVNVDNGQVMGHHNGLHQWTIGQRSRLQGHPEAFFTARKDLKDNIIYVAQGTKHPILYSKTLFTSEPHWIHSEPEDLRNADFLECEFKFQHTEKWVNCKVCKINNGLLVILEQPKRALTPGQYAVLSRNGECLGSARIQNAGASEFSLKYLIDELETFEDIKHRVELKHSITLKKHRDYNNTDFDEEFVKSAVS